MYEEKKMAGLYIRVSTEEQARFVEVSISMKVINVCFINRENK